MRFSILLPIFSALSVALTVWMLTGCKTETKQATVGEQLPENCSLLAMSPEDRSRHQGRLDSLRKATSFERKTDDGFEFSVDLHRMSADELGLWMENEQKCCSFLQIRRRIDEAQQHAHISVKCPLDLRTQVMETFRLRATDSRP